MECFFLMVGLIAVLVDIFLLPKSLRINIIKRLIFIFLGLICIYIIEPSYMFLTYKGVILAFTIGLIFIIIHLFISKGIKLKVTEY
ncbi:hypothetical protein [Clostridium sp. KNHs214]|uniref:hypothetical protein n=1 Tax=Clostridium sp. KNHs214 TaxID=1540257 RepID=UPI00054EEA25|nr:hypothetical protein [Clostridium sp. KNHs214]